MNENGCSTCPKDEEIFLKFRSRMLHEYLFQYDYRTEDGELFSCCKSSLEKCRNLRDEWITKKGLKPPSW